MTETCFSGSTSAQGELGHLESSQDDGSAAAVLCCSGQREGERALFTSPLLTALPPLHVHEPAHMHAFLTMLVSVAGVITGLQLHVRRLPVPARQTVRRHIRHGRQGHPVWTARRYLQVLAHVEGKGVRSSVASVAHVATHRI